MPHVFGVARVSRLVGAFAGELKVVAYDPHRLEEGVSVRPSCERTSTRENVDAMTSLH